jgi:hypothetical protein
MAASGLTPEREEQLTVDLLRDRVGIDPGKVGPVIDLAALGLVNDAWRNTCVEGWHAEGRLEDGDLLRASSHATWRVRQLIRRWMREAGLDAGSPASALDEITAEGTWQLAGRLYQWLASPVRKLPTGVTLAQLAGDDLGQYKDDADAGLSTFAVQAEERGARFGLARVAAHGGLACSHWWGHPRWAARVDQFMKVLGNPADDHWGPGSEYRAGLPAEPADVADRARLRRLLLSRPWELSTDAAQWVADADIRYIAGS